MTSEEENSLINELEGLYNYLVSGSKPLDPEFARVIEEEFWDLLMD